MAGMLPSGAQGRHGSAAGGLCPQRSLEDEISRTTAEDLPIFAISYLVIFLYISLALGSYTSWRRVLVRWGRGMGRGVWNLPSQSSLLRRNTAQRSPGLTPCTAPRQTPLCANLAHSVWRNVAPSSPESTSAG